MNDLTHARRFYVTAIAAGATFANVGVALPLQIAALGGSPTLVGGLLAVGTVSIAVGAMAAGVVSPRLGGAARTLALALAFCGVGSLAFSATTSVRAIAAATILVGAGIGLFWVSAHLLLGRRSGTPGSGSAFLVHFAVYTFGAVVGSGLTGGVIALARHGGAGTSAGARASTLVGLTISVAALVVWAPFARRAERDTPTKERIHVGPTRHLRVQLPDLLLVTALALLLPLVPSVLADGYSLGPFVIGLVMSCLSLAKIAGTYAARKLSRANGNRRTISSLLAGGGATCVLLCLALAAPVFVAILLATTLFAAGAWPLVVDSAQARVPPESRHELTVVWNVREYSTIAAGTLLAGWLFTTFGRPEPLFALAALLIAGAAVSSALVLRRPVCYPSG